ncbi:uncharacterized protein LOC141588007 [Silene latifolia]|uniref:uncharacterized protein LOC141588007 n=1 Tax=Silene latifolia TaxID=37657 RepID=UPI003D785517
MLERWSVTTNSTCHKGGRVWLLWKPSLFDVQVQSYDAQFIYAKVTSRITLQFFNLTMIYAFNDGQDRKVLWLHLEQFQTQCQGPWAWAGDFNTVINPADRLGGHTKQSDMDDFIDCIATCGITDIPATGAYFTWTNKQEPQSRVYSRLDRFPINQEWGDQFPDITAHFHPAGLFDHIPCIVSHTQLGSLKRASFKYFNMWGKAPSFHEIKVSESLRRLTEARDSFLLQKAKVNWSERGDSNSIYFHGVIKKRCNQNKVIQIEDQDGIAYSWAIVGDDICAAIKDFFYTGKLLNQINATNITLIPKCERPTSVKQFRPIACCNMIYKAISKLLCNRLALVLPDLISANQGAFIKGRYIIENVLICQYIVKLYNRKAVSRRCLFKIDLQKTYDTIEWGFVEQLYQKMGFPESFTHRVMTCVQSTSFSLCLNGSSFGYFKDDLLMFFKGNAHSIMLMIRAFSSFSKAFGLVMNNTKSVVYFNGVTQELKNDIQQVTGFVEGSMPFRYLGVPIQAGKLTKKECNILTEKMANRIRSLGAKKLSYAGRIVLINSVLNTLYSYWAGIFLITKAVIKRVEAICRNFLWDESSDYHRVPLADRLWIRWINQIYLKNREWHTYKPPADAAWAWKQVCKVKELMKQAYMNNQWTPDMTGYSVRHGYEWLRHTQPKKDWYSKKACCICEDADETLEHLFFSFDYSRQVLQCLESWCGFKIDVNMTVRGRMGVKSQAHAMLSSACCYYIWQQRNNAGMNGVLVRPASLAQNMIKQAKNRIKFMVSRNLHRGKREWLNKWGCMTSNVGKQAR